MVEHRKGEFRDLIADLRQRGFVRIRHNGTIRRLEDEWKLDKRKKHTLELVIDRLDPQQVDPATLTDSVETALKEGVGTMTVLPEHEGFEPLRLSRKLACVHCGIGMPELSPQSFSFNSPLGMCHTCNGLGQCVEMDPDTVVPDPSLSIREGAIAPLASIMKRGSGWNFNVFLGLQNEFGIDLDKPWKKMTAEQQRLVLYGTGNRRVKVSWNARHSAGHFDLRFEGILNSLMRRYRETRSEFMREYYQKYYSNMPCRDCGGARLRPESRAVTVGELGITDVIGMSIADTLRHFESIPLTGNEAVIAEEVLKEITSRLRFLCDVGLSYLTLSRSGPTLSSGEAQRIRLASQIGSELSGVMYVLDEPSIGLHPRDNRRLIDTLFRLRDIGNSVIVVEHDEETILEADYVADFGPGAGRLGGKVIFEGTPEELKKSDTLTGKYLSGRECIEIPPRRRKRSGSLKIIGASEHNLKGITVDIPLGTLSAVTGVSGAGKSTLISRILYPALCRKLHNSRVAVGKHKEIKGLDRIDKTIHIDQSPIGRTPRSNPATYTKCFDLIRQLFAAIPESRALGYKPGRFSFNVKGGRCDSCEGDGVKRVEMHFLPDVYVPCEVCGGKRYNEATLKVRFKGLNIAEVLDLSVLEACELFSAHPKIRRTLQTLADVGLEYIKLGQSATTLSGGEAQRVKLSRELAKTATGKTLYVLDEPTTGLHFDDIKKLLEVLNRLVDAGNTVVIIEHNLDVIKCADHIIDLGPEGGDAGGEIIAVGTPEDIAADDRSVTGRFLHTVLGTAGDRIAG